MPYCFDRIPTRRKGSTKAESFTEMTAEELNQHIHDGTIDEEVRVAEARQMKALSKIADIICGRPGIRLVLIAGGSSAGKTTTAKRICTQLRVNGRAALHLSTDDYFVGDARNPRDENGKLDYEHVECVDIPQLAADVNALLRGDVVKRRRFDFVNHVPIFTDEPVSLRKGGFVVLGCKFRVFVEPKPTLDVFGGITPRPTDIRFLRRMVRDNQFRKMNPVTTLEMWPNVLAGEQKWIEPFRGNADAGFDSYLSYELAVLRPYVGGLLERVRLEIGDQVFVMSMIRLLELVEPMSSVAVPGDSILRETIGGSLLEY